jgi:parallel beta-helix repeat protein
MKKRNRTIAVLAVAVLCGAALSLTQGPELLAWTDAAADAVSLSAPAQSTTCNSCADCTSKLESGSWVTVTLTADITNHAGTCVGLIHSESNVVFDCGGHTIDGDDIAIDPDHGVTMMHGSNNTIQNCTISDFSNGIYLWDATNHLITGNTLSSNGTGIELGFSHSNDINNNTFSENYNGIEVGNSNNNDIDSNTVCESTYLDFNMVSGTGNSGDNNTCDAPDGWNDDGTTGCTSMCAGTATCTSCSDCSSKLSGTFSTVLLTQDIYNHSGTCITFYGSNVEFDGGGHTIDGDDSGTDYGIYMNGKSGNTVKNCDVRDFHHGIYLSSSSGNTVSRNTANSNTGSGIYLFNSASNTIAIFNEANYNGERGIFLSSSNNNQVYFNEANSNTSSGIRLAGSDSNTVTFNDVLNNSSTNAWGMYLYDSDSNTISSNNLIGNYYGIKFDSSQSNTLNSNEVCSNPEADFDLVGGSTGNTGDLNTCCADPDEWNDTGATGCTYACDTAPDRNSNGISDACDCADAHQGLNETGIDCGGLCPTCLTVPSGWSNVTGVRLRGAPNSGRIDVVFVPEQSYSGNLTAFQTAVTNNIANWFLRLDDLTDETLPSNYQDKFNFYRYTGGFGTQSGCSGSLPGNFWSDAPGADLGAILAPASSGAWGCANGLGPPGGNLRLIAVAEREGQVMHESGHAIFGLVDQYCGDTYYTQTSNTSNVWSSFSNCQADATAQGWTDGSCTQIKSGSCSKSYWKYDTASLMDGSGFLCTSGNVCTHSTDAFKEACMWRMNWVFNNWPSGSSKGILAHFNINQGVITELGSEVVAGHPDVGLQIEDFRVELLAGGEEVFREYGIWDPRVEIGDGGEAIYSDNVDFSVIFPYEAGVEQADIVDPQTEEVKVSVDLSTLDCTCNSCSDCETKLKDPSCATVRLTTDIMDHAGTCISLYMGESHVVFDCDGHTIDGDDIAIDPDHGVTMMHGKGNTVMDCVISDFSHGIYLWDAMEHVLTGNTLTSNGAGIELGWSDANDINNNRATENYTGIAIGNSNDNRFESNIVCDNESLDFNLTSGTGNSGSNNRCDKPDGWNDDGTTGCSSPCAAAGVYISPTVSTVGISKTITIDVMASNVENLYGFQMQLDFDPSVVEVVDSNSLFPGVQIERGTFPVPDEVFINRANNALGTIEYYASLQGDKPGVSGSGVLARIVLHGLEVGTSELAFVDAILSDPQSVEIPADIEGGVVDVVEAVGAVSGRVVLERRTSDAGASVCIGALCATTSPTGTYSIPGVPAEAHTVAASHMSYLRSSRSISVPIGPLALPDVVLLAGDLDQDDHIDDVDSNLVGQIWNSTPADPQWNQAADITDDGRINILDMVAVQFNWDEAAPGAWGAAQAAGAPEVGEELWPAWHLRAEEDMMGMDVTTQVVVTPSHATLTAVGETVQLDIAVEDVSDLYSARVQLVFDPSVVQVQDADPGSPKVEIIPGDFLDPFSQFVVVNQVYTATGEIDFAVTQLYPAETRTGSGVLATVIFEALSEGTSPVDLVHVRLLDDTPLDPLEIPTGMQDGEIEVRGAHGVYLPLVLRMAGS